MPLDLHQFQMNPLEAALLRTLVEAAQPQWIAEFGSGLTTRFWGEHSQARIVTWDNYPEWLADLRAAFAGAPWLERVDWRLYAVTPPGVRTIEKDPVAWEGPLFDFLFLDGPRSAHPQNFGRSGTFRFATQYARPGATIVWHDAQRPHERQLARHYFGHCLRRREKSVGWCRWEPASAVPSWKKPWRKWRVFA